MKFVGRKEIKISFVTSVTLTSSVKAIKRVAVSYLYSKFPRYQSENDDDAQNDKKMVMKDNGEDLNVASYIFHTPKYQNINFICILQDVIY